MEGDFIKINESLIPFSWLYGMAVGIRNFCFEVGILRSRAFNVPVISVGNITVGGTGKTPHVEYLAQLLRESFGVAVLSRGYKRKTKGFVKADDNTTFRDIGDEPMQMHRKFPDITVAVDKKRVRGIEQLTANDQKLDVILLDDAFQHRYVKPGINILLVDYHRLIIYDRLLPAGRLREPQTGKNRADIVIVTKCPKGLKPMDFRVITRAMNLYPYQHLFFTSLDYATPYPVFPDEAKPFPFITAVPSAGAPAVPSAGASTVPSAGAPAVPSAGASTVPSPSSSGLGVGRGTASASASSPLSVLCDRHVLLLSGVASPRQLMEDLSPFTPHLTPLDFPDHHNFKKKDIELINSTFAALPQPKCIITTEKDATRLLQIKGLSDDVRRNLYALPIYITFTQPEQKEKFNENIIGYVRKNSRNSILVKGKDDYHPRDSHHSGDRSRTISFRNN